MATLKDVKQKISGIKKTKQITSAMKMVASSRLRGAQLNMEAFRPYAIKYAEVLGGIAKNTDQESNPLLTPREEVKKVNIILCTSDRGLCGGFNINLINKANAFADEHNKNDIDISFTNFGKKGRDWCKSKKNTIDAEYLGIVGSKFSFSIASSAGNELVKKYIDGTYDKVIVIYSQFAGVGKQVPTLKQLLPIPPIEATQTEEDEEYMAEHICEPSSDVLLNEMLPRNVYVQIYNALLETSASEHAARMTAMDNATNACTDMVKELQMLFNKARQAAITADLMDIVGGAEALKG